MGRFIETHHDGHGLNESIEIEADEPGPGGASHAYRAFVTVGEQATSDSPAPQRILVAAIHFQKGPRNVEGSEPGITTNVLLAIVRDHLEAFQAGEFRCRENACAITHIQEAMFWVRERADARAKRGVLGTLQK